MAKYVPPCQRDKSSSAPQSPQPVSSSHALIPLDVSKPFLVFPDCVSLQDEFACASACDTLIKSVAALNSSLSVSFSIELDPVDGVIQARLDAVAWFDAVMQLVDLDVAVANARTFVNDSREFLRRGLEVLDPSEHETTLVGSHCMNPVCTFTSTTCRNGAHPRMGRCAGKMLRQDSARACGWFFANELHIVDAG